MFAFSIPLLPVKVTVSKEKEVASRAPTAASAFSAFDTRDLAIMCMGVALVFSACAVLALALSKSVRL